MGLTSFRVNPERLRDLGMKIKANAEEYSKELTTIYNNVDALSSVWQGEDSQAYINKVNEYKDVLIALGKAIENHGNFLVNTSTSAESMKSELKAMANNMLPN